MLVRLIKNSFRYLTGNMNFYFLIAFFYNFCTSIKSNFFACSYIRDNIVCVDFGVFVYYFFFTYIILFIYYYRKNKFKVSSNYDWIIIVYRNYFNTEVAIFRTFNNFFNSIKFIFFWLLNYFKNLLVLNIFLDFFNKLFSVSYWYPIYKRYSYFGYFRDMRQKWTETKTEEITRFKY
jgi:hypothetical protein